MCAGPERGAADAATKAKKNFEFLLLEDSGIVGRIYRVNQKEEKPRKILGHTRWWQQY